MDQSEIIELIIGISAAIILCVVCIVVAFVLIRREENKHDEFERIMSRRQSRYFIRYREAIDNGDKDKARKMLKKCTKCCKWFNKDECLYSEFCDTCLVRVRPSNSCINKIINEAIDDHIDEKIGDAIDGNDDYI